MSHESRFRENDPARDMPPLGHHEREHLAVGAIAAEPHPVHLPRRRRSALYVATAAAAAVALALPVMQPWQGNGGPAVLRLAGVGSNSLQANGAKDAMLPGYAENSKMASPYIWWGGYKYVADVALSTEGQKGTVFKIVTRGDAKEIVRRIADTFDVPEPDYDNGGYTVDSGTATKTSPDGSTSSGEIASGQTQEYLYAYVTESGGYFGYYNDALSPWRECWYNRDDGSATEPSDPGAPEECVPPTATNLPTNAEAKALVRNRLDGWGFDVDNLRFEAYRDDWQVSVSATAVVAGFDSPVSWGFTLVDDSKISNVYGSLDRLIALDEYDLISPAAAIDRANRLVDDQYQAYLDWMESQPTDRPTSGEGSASVEPGSPGEEPVPIDPTDPGLSPEPRPTSTSIEPSIEPTDGPTIEPKPIPEPSWTQQTVHVTRVERGMQWVTAADGTNLWIPTYEFYGYVEDSEETFAWPLGSVIAVVDSQIDLSQFTGGYYGGVRPMTDEGVPVDTLTRKG